MSDEFTPLSYTDWLALNGLSSTDDSSGYSAYLVKWYDNKKIPNENLKQQYIQLLKEINYVFGDEKRDRFLSQIDFNNNEDLINSLPYFTQKIKELVKSFTEKREALKKSKLKYNLISSNRGVEKLLYEYILRSFTSKNKIAPVPYKEFSNLIPELNNVNDLFYIEVEELYDKSNYFDQSPKTNIQNNINTDQLLKTFPYSGNLNKNQLIGLLNTSVKERGVNDPLSDFYKQFLNLTELEEDIREYDYLNAINTVVANEKYMGNDLYSLSAIKFEQEDDVDATISLDLIQGNNWFYWPSGDKIYDFNRIDNIYASIPINDSNFVSSGSVGGDSYKNSDIILTDKKGYIEGAWLMGPRIETTKQNVSFTAEMNQKRQFIWPYTGFNLTKNTNQWRGFLTNDESNKFFYFLSDNEKNIILNNYYTSDLPSLSSENIYLNFTEFYKQGAYADKTALDSDVIIKQKHIAGKFPSYNDLIGTTEVAYLYKFDETELPIQVGINNLVWPLISTQTEDFNLPLTITNDFCDPVQLNWVDVEKSFRGAVAGFNMDDSDIIYKLDKRSGNPIEAAWLKNISFNDLNISNNEIKIYNTKATCCEKYLDGVNQNGLYTVVESGERVSFIWMDKDTPANEVFRYTPHQTNCEYDDEKREYYFDQDYANPNPLNNNPDLWNLCSCKSVLYSPIGHKGKVVTDYDGMCDMLYADPQGLGADFEFNTWKDTRCLDYKSSPQFSFYQLNNENSNVVGFGRGIWKTSTGSQMILKTGRRYTYYRTHFKKLNNSGPKYVILYDYKDQTANCLSNQPYDIVLCVDISESQKYNLDVTEKIVTEIVVNKPNNVQIGIVAFNGQAIRCSYISEFTDLTNFLNLLNDFDETEQFTRSTNIYEALQLSNFLLTTVISENNKESIIDFNRLCTSINATLLNAQRVPVYNQPRKDAIKRIIVLSDGTETSPNAKDNGKLLVLDYVKQLKSEINLLGSLDTISDLNNIEGNQKNDAYFVNDVDQIYIWDGTSWVISKKTTIQIQTIDIGPTSTTNNVMETIATKGLYFNLQKYLNVNDVHDIDKIVKDIVYKIAKCNDVRSRWCKMVRNQNGVWVSTLEESDMILNPNDNLIYLHREVSEFSSPVDSYVAFALPSINFAIKIPLRGWDYQTNKYIKDDVVVYKGAKPYWGKAYVNIDEENNFNKELIYMGGHVRWLDYLPLTNPEVSMLVLENSDFIEYVRRKAERVKLTHNVVFKEYKSNYQWNKLEFTKQYSNLSNFFKNDRLEYIAKATKEKSDLVLEEFYEFKPAKYNYFARESFTLTQNLFLLYQCNPTYSQILSAKIMEAQNPYAHLDNVNYPTIATVPYTNNFITKKETGFYLIPTKLGVPYFSGIGYNIQIDESKIYDLEKRKVEPIFLDPEKYGPITRGLSDTDNLSPTKIQSIDNRWMMLPYGSGDVSGTITNTKNTQKFTPYQSEYEILGINQYGLSRPTDQFQFYDEKRRWTGGGLNYRGEVSESVYLDRRNKFLSNLSVMTIWKMDIFGNNYGIFKANEDANYIETDQTGINYNDINYDRERLSSDDYPKTQDFPEDYENITYNVREQDYLDFIVEEE